MKQEALRPVRRRNYTQHPFSERKRAVDLRTQGFSSKEIGQILQVDDSLVRAWIRKYRAFGEVGLHPYMRVSMKRTDNPRVVFRETRDRLFASAFQVYESSLEPVLSITRRYNLDYHAFLYHVTRYHPELVEKRKKMKRTIIQNHTHEKENNI